jgi:hypothetical protein
MPAKRRSKGEGEGGEDGRRERSDVVKAPTEWEERRAEGENREGGEGSEAVKAPTKRKEAEEEVQRVGETLPRRRRRGTEQRGAKMRRRARPKRRRRAKGAKLPERRALGKKADGTRTGRMPFPPIPSHSIRDPCSSSTTNAAQRNPPRATELNAAQCVLQRPNKL